MRGNGIEAMLLIDAAKAIPYPTAAQTLSTKLGLKNLSTNDIVFKNPLPIYSRCIVKMSHPGTRTRVASDEEEVELAGTQIGIADDDEIQRNHNLQERDTLIGNTRIRKKKSCIHSACRIILGIVATAVFTFMMIQLWSNYGETIKARVFAPQVIAAGAFDADGEEGEMFGVKFIKWDNTTLHINTSKPKHEMLQVNFQTPQSWSYDWEDDLLKIDLDIVDSVSIVAWSI